MFIKKIFTEEASSNAGSFLSLLIICLVLFWGDHHFKLFKFVRSPANVVILRMQQIVNWPFAVLKTGINLTLRYHQVMHQYEQLQQDNLALKAELQRLSFARHEDEMLRSLVWRRVNSGERFLVGKVVELITDDFDHMLTINLGSEDGVRVGQPVLGTRGLLGQIVMSGHGLSKVLPITSKKSAVPVLVLGNGMQTIALGTGDKAVLELIGVTETSGVRVGDKVVTSGIGGVFPVGYNVGVVSKVSLLRGARFLKVLVRPEMSIDSNPYVLLILKEQNRP